MQRIRQTLGFTLIEVLLSVAIIGLLLGISAPIYASFQNRNDLDIATESIAWTLRRASTYARSVNQDNQWGVEIQSGVVTLFMGSVFASRDSTKDETISYPISIAISGTTEVIFNKLTGLPVSTGSTTLTNTFSSRTVTISAKGVVDV